MTEQSYLNINRKIRDLELELEHTIKNLIVIKGEIKTIKKEITDIQKKITQLDKKVECDQDVIFESLRYGRYFLTSTMNTKKTKLKSLELIVSVNTISGRRKTIRELKKSVTLFEKNREKEIRQDNIKNSTSTFPQIDLALPKWEDIYFFEGYVEIRINNINRRFKVGQSKKYLNQIKNYYTFKNVPKLEVVFSDNEIKEIKNIEILFYHIDFLTIANNFFLTEKFQISKFTKYTKSYFKKYIPFAFTTNSLTFLCEICDEDFPIIPVPELVMNGNQSKMIHDSFLFKCGNKIVWESVETSKASYVFKFENFNEDAQYIFDFVTNGNVINKRQTLIRSYNLRDKLKLRTRIYHNEFGEWKREISSITDS